LAAFIAVGGGGVGEDAVLDAELVVIDVVALEVEVVLGVAVLAPDVVLDAVVVPGPCALPPHPARMPTLAARRTSRLDLAMRWTAPPRGCCDDVLTVQTVSSTAPPVIRHEEASSLRLIM
jgi:hypothetical protein